VKVRTAQSGDFTAMQQIERSAGELFREVGMPGIADDDPPSMVELAEYTDDGRGWVLVDDDDHPVGYVIVDVVDGCAHIEQVSVHREHHRHGYGKQLIDHVVGWARSAAMPAVTLTTFTDVPWNAPYYEGYGFRRLTEAELTPGLVELRAHEAEEGLDPDIRVCMRLDLSK
jgi:GNAT superfamily N-acetyltransferase